MRDGRFTPGKLRRVLTATCARLDLDPRGAQLLRFTNNAVYALVRTPVVVRIVGSTRLRHRAATVVQVAEYLARHGIPAVRLVESVQQPMDVDGHLVTVWHRVPFTGPPASTADLAGLLRRVHALAPPDGLGEWQPLRSVRDRVQDAEELAEDDRRFLLDRCAELADRLAGLDFPLATGFVHGDAYPGNVLPGPEGPVLCDFDSSCVGPPEWDLTPLAVGRERFGDPPERYAEFARAYGFDVTRWSGFAVLRAVRELKLTTSVLPILRSHPPVRSELRRRLADLRCGRSQAQWSRYR
ncbi:aminoglycoside phosphotransferase (APT) family kinase protein [Amycolatopsis sulphurea]|uniref:Aminoglycoside phosphotransferase (APT) family kinase protein n=1 Tax=Amycolatopsis sulphurea TaxID=76022 RepID=A0A2A9FCJ5_9PSEU|nr:aminoglycoside phosphotransferase family protein [Amycolatopsis sulphurea]PFG48220.1 aminoglycoside phosphotransferase (APT) family kinase protein [Amycolatopsis sulphurea]